DDRGQRADKAAALRLLGAVAGGRGSRDARRRYGQAIALADSLGMRPFVAVSRLDPGVRLRRGSDPAPRATPEEARAAVKELAMRFWESVARAELSALA